MLESFKEYLIQQGYSELTPSGKPSTVYDYQKRIIKICDREYTNLNDLAKNIDFYVEKYGPAGNEAEFGKRSHNAFLSALKKFRDFIKTNKDSERL